MGIFGRMTAFLAMLALGTVPGLAAPERPDAPASGVFITLEKTNGGALKYDGTERDGTFEIRDLAKGKYKMSITPPRRDRTEEFDLTVRGSFVGIRVIPDGKDVKRREVREDERKARNGSVIRIPASRWREKAIWLEVTIERERVSGRFDYIIEPVPAAVVVED